MFHYDHHDHEYDAELLAQPSCVGCKNRSRHVFRAKNRARRNGVQLGLVSDPSCQPPNRRRFQQVFQSHQLATSNLISQASRTTTGKKREFFRSFHHCSRSRFLPLKTLSVSSSPDRLKNRRIFNRTYSSARLCNLHYFFIFSPPPSVLPKMKSSTVHNIHLPLCEATKSREEIQRPPGATT